MASKCGAVIKTRIVKRDLFRRLSLSTWEMCTYQTASGTLPTISKHAMNVCQLILPILCLERAQNKTVLNQSWLLKINKIYLQLLFDNIRTISWNFMIEAGGDHSAQPAKPVKDNLYFVLESIPAFPLWQESVGYPPSLLPARGAMV